MSPSTTLPLPPPASLTACFEGDGAVHPSNGHSPSDTISPSAIIIQPKLPGKSSLKRHSTFVGPRQQQQPSPSSMRHCPTLAGCAVVDIGVVESKSLIEQDSSDAVGDRGDVVLEDEFFYKRRDSRVTWTDNQGKDLAEVWEFEPSFSGDSDEESESDSSQSCACVIQ